MVEAYRLALEDLSRAVELLPADTEIFECFVNTLEELIEHGNEDASDCILRAANSFRPNSANHYRSRGELFIKLGDSGRALEDFEQALHLGIFFLACTGVPTTFRSYLLTCV